MKPIRLGIVGATGLVGRELLHTLEPLNLPIEKLRLFASAKSMGTLLPFQGREIQVECLESTQDPFSSLDCVFFSAGKAISLSYVSKAIQSGCHVIDNSSAYRLDREVPLVTAHVNGNLIDEIKRAKKPTLIANPNCSTIQLCWPLKALADAFGIEDVVVSTYQSVTGGGLKVLQKLRRETEHELSKCETEALPKTDTDLGLNLIPHIGELDGNGYCEEELKIIRETRKILGQSELSISATTIRVPVLNGHSESVSVTLRKSPQLEAVKSCFQAFKGLRFYDTLHRDLTPGGMSGTNEVAIGRLRADESHPNRFHFWVVADNLRVGAAYNAVEILERLYS